MPEREQAKLAQLIDALKASGPVQPSFANYSKLGEGDYLCHLSRKWVACWVETKAGIEIEVYNVGCQEKKAY